MAVDVAAAETFMLTNARLLERRRLAVLLGDGAADDVLLGLRPYRNPDGGFGQALEPDVRAPDSEPSAALQALEVIAGVGRRADAMVSGVAEWIGRIALPDGGVPFVMATAAAYPHAPWMVPSGGGSHLTFALAARLWELGADTEWRERATEWCWAKLGNPDELSAFWLKFGLEFCDRVPDEVRAREAVEGLRRRIGPDGSVPVPGGTEDERLTPLDLSERPGSRSRALFAPEQIEADLDRLEREQAQDGGWTFDWLAWCPGQALEWRGLVTLRALELLLTHGRIARPGA